MMNPDDLEKDDAHSETENSHSATHATDGDEAHYQGKVVIRQDKKVVSPKAPTLIVVVLAVLALVIILPSVLVHRNNDDDNNNTLNQAIHLEEDEVSSSTAATTATTSVQYDTFEYTPQDNEQCSGHLEGEYGEVSSMWALDLSMGQRGTTGDRTFEVEPSNTVLENGQGVVFAVETVTEPLEEDLTKPHLSKSEIMEQVSKESSQFYQNVTVFTFPPPPPPNVSLEVLSKTPDDLVYSGNQAFLAACMMSFAQHLPLALSPDHLWTIIAQGFARHVDHHADELRSIFVDHDGKKEIRIREDSMVRGESPPEQWEELIFPRFSQEIGKNMNNPEVYETLSQRVFSTSTATTQAASEIVLMAAMKNFFEYTMVTACGIPEIRLEGSRADWVALIERTEKLSKWMMPNSTHGELWITDIVLPILEQFLQAYDGHVNYCFWQTMVKFRTTGGGSGSYEFLSGWLPTLFPYLSQDVGETKPNPFLRTWEESASALMKGPQPNQVPSQLSSVPVKWEYFNQDYPLHFHAGFRGVTQEADGTLAPVLGWYITNDPEADSQ